MASKHVKHNEDETWDKTSECSDVSATTDIKVFLGAINKGEDYISKLSSTNKEANAKTKQSKFAIYKGSRSVPRNGIKKEVNNEAHIPIVPKEDNDLLSFRNSNENTTNNETQKPVLQSSKSLVDIKGLYGNGNDNDSPQAKQNQQVMMQSLISKFKDFSADDNNFGYYGDNKKINSNQQKKNEKATMKNYTRATTLFRIATIEKGIALLVSNEDCIFTMPTFLLPKGAKVGFSYQIAIEETKKGQEAKQNIAMIQKSFIK